MRHTSQERLKANKLAFIKYNTFILLKEERVPEAIEFAKLNALSVEDFGKIQIMRMTLLIILFQLIGTEIKSQLVIEQAAQPDNLTGRAYNTTV